MKFMWGVILTNTDFKDFRFFLKISFTLRLLNLMLTPVFQLSQNERFLTVTIRAPHCNLKNAEVSYEEKTFLFSARPYFLRLFLPAEVIDDETGTTDYDSDQGVFTIRVPKKVPGEHFPRLEMLSELLNPQRPQEPSASRLVEELRSPDEEENVENNLEETFNENLIDELYAKQELVEEFNIGEDNRIDEKQPHPLDLLKSPPPSLRTLEQYGYGFGWRRMDVLGRFHDEIRGLFDLEEPEDTPIDERTFLLARYDEDHFSPDHYVADLMEPSEELKATLLFDLQPKLHLTLTDKDFEDLKDLKRRQLERFSVEQSHQVALSLIDLIFAFLYDLRTTDAEPTSESSWTLAKLAPSLSFLVRWDSARDALVGALRRSVCYPLYRNWDLSQRVLEDLKRTLKLGRSAILHALLTMRRLFNKGSEFRYLFNQLYIEDYCLWVQSIPDSELTWLQAEVEREAPSLVKFSLGLDLDMLEMDARLRVLEVSGETTKIKESGEDSEADGKIDGDSEGRKENTINFEIDNERGDGTKFDDPILAQNEKKQDGKEAIEEEGKTFSLDSDDDEE